ncbi:glycerophosphodiester phosphodiesterase GDPDL7 [Cinnamomum micranthum f. kanehirae]|uniref:glycerophosphodiester phosphodiesterase n=1 Tax=Cinnamomum micranthum f. kanehirae TaxID=337451 RepID=A0A443PK25_9MAGN|nr:glycerophosphodiester phosphodiesterase GDPDL7 [Cinnamomum micranthum f. kanehirae]
MVRCLFFILLLLHGVVGQKSIQKWPTFSGEAPLIVARGGYSGLFPESSEYAYQFATTTGISGGVGLFCDLQLTKDGVGICRTDLRLDNSTTIEDIFPKGKKSYPVNGKPVSGWFSVDYTMDQIFSNVTIIQNIFSRPSIFDASLPMMTIDDLMGLKPPKLWLNVQYDMFFKEHKLDIGAFVLDASTHMRINYISSPEIGFLKGLNEKLRKGKTKLIFRFLEPDSTEPSTKQKYSSILENLSSIKAFASGILVPKEYIWPVSKEGYLQPHTNLVADAHKKGLEVFASGFANDNPGSYNYSYDPSAEYLQFIDNPDSSVDGVLTDFPSTASGALACFAQNKNSTVPTKGKPLIITHNGASGVYPGCTDLAYQQAVDDGADIIDCSVQMSKDGVAFCLNSADLMGDTTAMTAFISRSTTVPEIQQKSGIFSFDLTWSEIQALKPEMISPVAQADLKRNPAYKNQGKFFTLSDFLDFAKGKAVPGILINIQNAAYLASNKGLDITDAVISALSKAGYDKETTQQVLIQSDDTSVLSAFQKFSNYKRVLMVPEVIGDAAKPAVEEIKHFANAVTLSRGSIVITENGFITGFTDVVNKMHAANISVYVSTLINEYVAIAFDYFSDPMVEISTYINALTVDGIMTEFPATATKFMRSPCFHPADDAPYSILPAQAGSLVSLVPPELLPPSEPPAPALTVANVVDPPLPSVKKVAPAPGKAGTSSGQATVTIDMSLCLVMLVFSFMSLSYH